MDSEKLKKILICLVLVLLAVISFFPIGNMASSTATHTERISKIDNNIDTVLKLSASATAISVVITALPDDTATPIAEKFADFTGYFLVILTVLYAEKYLLTILGIGAFKIIIPFALITLGAGLVINNKGFKILAKKLLIFGISVYIAIPLGLMVSDKIYETYETNINTTIEAAEEIAEDTAGVTSNSGNPVSSAINSISSAASGLLNRATNMVTRFVESVAVLIVTSCVIPLLVILFMFWLAKMVLGVDISVMTFNVPGRRR